MLLVSIRRAQQDALMSIEYQILFFFYLGFTALSRTFHLYGADRPSRVGENRRMGEVGGGV